MPASSKARVSRDPAPRGFEYAGQVSKLLSADAKAIAGKHWNGLLFVGPGSDGLAQEKAPSERAAGTTDRISRMLQQEMQTPQFTTLFPSAGAHAYLGELHTYPHALRSVTSMSTSCFPVRRLRTDWKMEAFHAVVIPAFAIFLVLKSGGAISTARVLSGLACSFLLVIGTMCCE